MAEGFNIEDINKKIEEITSALDAIKAQNALGIGDTSRFLININDKLDSLANTKQDNTETINLVADLKKSLEDRYSFINVKFTELESAFKSVAESQSCLSIVLYKR